MKEIKLSRGEFALVDDEDFNYLNQWKWAVMPRVNNRYAVRGLKIKGKHKTILMHREIIRNIEFGKEIDHIDRNGLNNQKRNLRVVSHSENLYNSRDRSFNKKIGLKKKNNQWVIYLINNNEITDIRWFDRQKIALQDIRKNRKYYLELI